MTVFDFIASNLDAPMSVHLIDDKTDKLIDILTPSKSRGLEPTRFDNAEVLGWALLSADNEYGVYIDYDE